MKRTLFVSLLSAVVLFASCDLQLPKSMKVKTKAEYNFTVAKLDFKLSDYLKIDELIPTDESSPFKIYDYNPSDNSEKVQQLLLRMPIQEIPLDFSSYMASTDLGDSLSGMNISQEIEIPKMLIALDKPVTASELNSNINQLVNIEGYTASSVDVEIIGGSFNTISYTSGKMIVQVFDSVTGGVRLVKTNPDGTLNKVISSGTFTTSGGISSAELNMTGKEIVYGSTELWFDESVTANIHFLARMDEGSVLKKVTGLSSTETLEIDVNETIDGSALASVVESIVFGNDCYFDMNFVMPSSWSGVVFEKSVSLSGGLYLDIPSTAENIHYSLADKVFECSDVSANIKGRIKINNATITFADDAKIKLGLDVNTLKQVVVNKGDLSTEINVNQALPAEATNMIQKIIWNKGTGIKIKYTNTFPEGNDFSLVNVKSNFLGLPTDSADLKSNTSNSLISFITSSEVESVISESTRIDFSGEMILPGEDTNPGKITMKNVKSGEKYKLEIQVDPVLDWKEIFVNNEIAKISQKIDIDFNKEEVFKQFDEQFKTNISSSIELSKMPIYLFCDVPGIGTVFTEPKFTGSIKGYLSDGENKAAGSPEVVLLNGDMPIAPEPKLVFDANNVLTTKINGGVNGDFAELINKANASNKITVDFSVGFATGSASDSIRIEKSKISKASSTSINLTAMIILPLDFNISSTQKINLMEMFGNDSTKDIFGRTEQPERSKIEDILKNVKSAGVFFKPEKQLFISDSENPIALKIDIDGPIGLTYEPQMINLNGGSFILEDPASILSLYPIIPQVELIISEGRIALPRDAALTTPVRVNVVTDGYIDVFGGEDHD